jgi:hypothetical protein
MQTPPNPAARSTDSSEILEPFATTHSNLTHNMEDHGEGDTTHPGRVVVTIPAELMANLRSECDNKASISLLGRIQGKHPGTKALTAWARETLHFSLTLLSVQANNMFELTFEKPEGRTHALNQTDLTCESASIFLSSWRPHFDASQPHATDRFTSRKHGKKEPRSFSHCGSFDHYFATT